MLTMIAGFWLWQAAVFHPDIGFPTWTTDRQEIGGEA